VVKGGPRPVVVQIREQITGLIANGDLAAGMRLPPVRDLAHQLGLNQMTVAKAYKDLGESGFVEGRRGGGTFVREANEVGAKRHRRVAVDGEVRPLLAERLFELGRAPGVIAFTGNFPRPEPASVDEFRACLAAVMDRNVSDLAASFSYGPPAGQPELRRRIAAFLQPQDIHAAADDVIVTSGAQQAIDLVMRSLVAPGSPVVVERPAYHGAINAMRSAGARIFEIPLDSDGMDLTLLESVLSRHRPRLIYTNPTFHNPTGVTTSLDKRRALLALAQRYGAAILEDDHSPELRYAGEPVPPIRGLPGAEATVFYARGFGKVFLPGMRLGFLVVPPDARRSLLVAKANTDLHTNILMQEALALYLARGRYPTFVRALQSAYAERQRQLCDSLRAGMPADTLIEVPQGGLSIWLTLPQGADVSKLYFRSVRRGVAFVAGDVFYASRPDPRTLRVSFGLNDPAELQEGVSRLCSVAHDLLVSQSSSPLMVI
jgi:DNA-binding transcriptional MocR family regulator